MNGEFDHEKVIKGLECCTHPGTCGCCPFDIKGDDETHTCLLNLINETYEMVKAQEPRVMTLNELDELRGRGRVVYYEDRNAIAKCQDVFYIATIDEYVYFKGETYVFPKRVDQYGKTWRCLTSRPTDEQGEVTEWN